MTNKNIFQSKQLVRRVACCIALWISAGFIFASAFNLFQYAALAEVNVENLDSHT